MSYARALGHGMDKRDWPPSQQQQQQPPPVRFAASNSISNAPRVLGGVWSPHGFYAPSPPPPPHAHPQWTYQQPRPHGYTPSPPLPPPLPPQHSHPQWQHQQPRPPQPPPSRAAASTAAGGGGGGSSFSGSSSSSSLKHLPTPGSLKRALAAGDFAGLVAWSAAHVPALLGGAGTGAPATDAGGGGGGGGCDTARFLAQLEAHRYPLSLERTLKTLHLLTLYEIAPSESTRAYVEDAVAKQQLGELQESERDELAAALAARAAAGAGVFGAGLLTFALRRHLAMVQRMFVRILPLWRELAAHPDAAASAAVDSRTLELMRAAAAATAAGGGCGRGDGAGRPRGGSLLSQSDDDDDELMTLAPPPPPATVPPGAADGGDGASTRRDPVAMMLLQDDGDGRGDGEDADADTEGGGDMATGLLDTARSGAGLSQAAPAAASAPVSASAASSVGAASASSSGGGSGDKSSRVTLSDASGHEEHAEKLGCLVRFCSERPGDVRVHDGSTHGSVVSLAALGDPRKPWLHPAQQPPQPPRFGGAAGAPFYRGSGGSGSGGGGGYGAPPSRVPPPAGPPPPPPRDLVSIDDLPAHYRRYARPVPEQLAALARARPGTIQWTCLAEEWRRGGPKSSLDGHGDLLLLALTPELLGALRAAADAVAREGLPHPRPPALQPSPVADGGGGSGSGKGGGRGSPPLMAAAAAPADSGGSAPRPPAVPPLPLQQLMMTQPTPVMEAFKPLLATPEHEELVAAVASRYLRGSLPLATVEAKYVRRAARTRPCVCTARAPARAPAACARSSLRAPALAPAPTRLTSLTP